MVVSGVRSHEVLHAVRKLDYVLIVKRRHREVSSRGLACVTERPLYLLVEKELWHVVGPESLARSSSAWEQTAVPSWA